LMLSMIMSNIWISLSLKYELVFFASIIYYYPWSMD
jgi:hypothetical protein